MKNLKGLFVAAAVASLMASKVVNANETAAPTTGDEVKKEANGCKGNAGCKADANKCKGEAKCKGKHKAKKAKKGAEAPAEGQ